MDLNQFVKMAMADLAEFGVTEIEFDLNIGEGFFFTKNKNGELIRNNCVEVSSSNSVFENRIKFRLKIGMD